MPLRDRSASAWPRAENSWRDLRQVGARDRADPRALIAAFKIKDGAARSRDQLRAQARRPRRSTPSAFQPNPIRFPRRGSRKRIVAPDGNEIVGTTMP
jgi:hypothetical protein